MPPKSEDFPTDPAPPGTGAGGPRTVGQWRRWLAEYSTEMLSVADEDQRDLMSDAQRAAGRLGAEGADEARLTALEERLGTRLPPSFRSFLGASDGWLTLGVPDWQMRTTDTIGWLREEEPWLWEIVREFEGPRPADHALLISVVEDQDYWLLDSSDVAGDGEWAAYRSVAHEPQRYASFAGMMAAQRRGLEEMAGAAGRPFHPEGAGELVAEGRALALRGEAEAALETFGKAATKGSGAATYLCAMLEAFLDVTDYRYGRRTSWEKVHRAVLEQPHVMAAVGPEQVRGEAAAVVLRGQADALLDWDERTSGPFWHGRLAEVLPEAARQPGETDAGWAARAGSLLPPPLPETPVFAQELEAARSLVRSGAADEAWAVVEAALPLWRSDSPYRVVPVVLLTDPVLRRLITPARARQIVTTPRQDGLPQGLLRK